MVGGIAKSRSIIGGGGTVVAEYLFCPGPSEVQKMTPGHGANREGIQHQNREKKA